MIIKVFSTQYCPKCQRLKKFLSDIGIEYKSMDMETAEGMSELFNNFIYTFNAPVLQVDNSFLVTEKLFNGVQLNEELIRSITKENI